MIARRIRILSSSADGISHSFVALSRERYHQHSKIKFLSPRVHVISCMDHAISVKMTTMIVISFAAVLGDVTQRSPPKERCVTSH